MKALLRAAAADLRRGVRPLDHAFLVEHDVTLGEAYDLADWLAAGADTLVELDRTGPGRRMIAVAIASAVAS